MKPRIIHINKRLRGIPRHVQLNHEINTGPVAILNEDRVQRIARVKQSAISWNKVSNSAVRRLSATETSDPVTRAVSNYIHQVCTRQIYIFSPLQKNTTVRSHTLIRGAIRPATASPSAATQCTPYDPPPQVSQRCHRDPRTCHRCDTHNIEPRRMNISEHT